MSFQTGLSGLSAASQNLDVIGNNIANANTVGMKSSRGEFSDLMASNMGSPSKVAGCGVMETTISQNFNQGSLTMTGNSLDLAINGQGFYPVTHNNGGLPPTTTYTRDGQFKIDKDGSIVNNSGSQLMGYPTDLNGVPTSKILTPLTVPTGAPIAAKPTGLITAEFNLDASAPMPLSSTSATQYGTSINVYDSQGVAIPVSLYFVKSGQDQWDAYDSPAKAQQAVADISATPSVAPTGQTLTLTFNPDGSINTPGAAQPITLQSPNINVGPNGDGTFTATIDVTKATQYGTNFAVSNLTQDGYTSGEYTGMTVDTKGVISTRYSNGQTLKNGGMVALADFRNMQGLKAMGGGEYMASYESGPPVMGQPGIGKFGEVRSGAVEESNVDLTSELVNMMTAQRNYQANAQTIKTQDQVLTTVINLR